MASPGVVLFVSIGARCTVDREPRMHNMADRSRLKLIVVRSHAIVVAYVSLCFSASREAKCCRKVVVRRLAPPDVEKISGVKEARSTSRTRSSYMFCFACSCRLYTEAREAERFDCARGLKILTSNNAQSGQLPQKPCALMSRRASGSREVVRR